MASNRRFGGALALLLRRSRKMCGRHLDAVQIPPIWTLFKCVSGLLPGPARQGSRRWLSWPISNASWTGPRRWPSSRWAWSRRSPPLSWPPP